MESLRQRRLAKGLTMKELGAMADVSESMIQMLETGKRKPSFEVLLKLSEALDCSADDLMKDKKIPVTEDDGLTEKQRELIDIVRKLPDHVVSILLPLAKGLLTGQQSLDGQ